MTLTENIDGPTIGCTTTEELSTKSVHLIEHGGNVSTFDAIEFRLNPFDEYDRDGDRLLLSCYVAGVPDDLVNHGAFTGSADDVELIRTTHIDWDDVLAVKVKYKTETSLSELDDIDYYNGVGQ